MNCFKMGQEESWALKYFKKCKERSLAQDKTSLVLEDFLHKV